MEEAEVRKRKHPVDQNYENAPSLYDNKDVDDDDDFAELEIEEEAVIAAMRKLEEEISLPQPPPPTTRFLTARVSESCGSSFSDLASTVMAGLVGVAVDVASPAAEVWPWAAAYGDAVGSTEEEEEEGEEEYEDEWLARALDGPGFDLKEGFV